MTGISNMITNIIKSRKESKSNDLYYFNSLKQGPIHSRETLSQRIDINQDICIISEIKPQSPTLGKIREDINVKVIAKQMEKAGVVGLSVLTEPNFFNGSYKNLQIAIENTDLPCLMKDFVVNEVQLKIAKELGATNILLINSIVDITEFYPLSLKYELEPLIEIHEDKEIEDIIKLRALGFDPKLIGVNNRNLKSLQVKLQNSLDLIPKLKMEFGNEQLIISESGIQTSQDIKLLRSSGADAFLIGSSIMQAKDINNKILELRGVK